MVLNIPFINVPSCQRIRVATMQSPFAGRRKARVIRQDDEDGREEKPDTVMANANDNDQGISKYLNIHDQFLTLFLVHLANTPQNPFLLSAGRPQNQKAVPPFASLLALVAPR